MKTSLLTPRQRLVIKLTTLAAIRDNFAKQKSNADEIDTSKQILKGNEKPKV